jgi:GGDEF domain-containing protein
VRACDAQAAEALIACADKALYAAKEAGRNTWRMLSEPSSVAEASAP